MYLDRGAFCNEYYG